MSSPEPTKTSPSKTSDQPADASSPDLVALKPDEAASAPEPRSQASTPRVTKPEPPQETGVVGRYITWALVLGLVICGIALLKQVQYSNRLEAAVATLTTELSGAHQQIEQHEAKLGAIREHVGDLFTRVGVLRDLVTDSSDSSDSSAASGSEISATTAPAETAAEAFPIESEKSASSDAGETLGGDPMAVHSTDEGGAPGPTHDAVSVSELGGDYTDFGYGPISQDLPTLAY